MTDPFVTTGDVLRRTGKITIILQVYSVGLLIVLCLLYSDISKRYTLLQDGVRENAIWSVYQLDREARALDHEFDLAVARSNSFEGRRQELSTRYDILYSRVNVLKDSRFQDFFIGDEAITKFIAEITGIILHAEPLFNHIKNPAKDNAAQIKFTSEQIDLLITKTQAFLTYANTRIAEARAENRSQAGNLEHTSAVFLILLIAAVLFLIFNLQRQLTNMREAGANMEIMTRKLSEAYNAADAGNRAKSQFMATIGHEIRTPLNGILGMAELLELTKLPPDVLENVRSIRGSGEALLEILNEVLDYSKIEHGKLELESRAVDIRNLVDTTANIIRARATEHGNTIVLDIPETLQAAVVKTDPTRLRQVILNLMSNAVKFTDKGTVTLRIREIAVPEEHDKGNNTEALNMSLRVEVIDTGIGIDEVGKEKLFKPFSQVDATITRKYGGTGLGLTICKQIVERLGGKMGVDSKRGVGSTFWFEIPVVPTDEKVANHRVSAAKTLPALPPLSILLVEDNRVNQQVVTRFLGCLGQSADIASNGQQAVNMTLENDYDLILMDMQMPIMDGIEATRQIKGRKTRNAATPVIAMTANASDDDRRACMEVGMAGFELKPITLSRLHNLLERTASLELCGMMQEFMDAHPVIDIEHIPYVTRSADLIPMKANTTAALDEKRKLELIEVLGEDDFNSLLLSYYSDVDELLSDLNTALKSEDPKLIDRALHSIKGAASNVGFNSIAQLAEEMRHAPLVPVEVSTLKSLIESQKMYKAA